MKRLFLLLMLVAVFGITGVVFPQSAAQIASSGSFTGGVGMAVIDDQTYFTINLHPDVAIGKLGIGLNINLLYNSETGELRPEDWNESYDYARLIRYIRWGHKRDPFYTRVGILDAARLGHGFIMNYYTNEASYDARKIGLELDMDFGSWGVETVTSNMGRLEIIGGRAYVRPLRQVLTIPMIKNIAFGGTYVTDIDPDGNRSTSDGMYEIGFDVEMPLLTLPMFNSFIYYDWAKIDTLGHGQAVGAEANLTLIAGIAAMTARLERRWLGEQFLPSYFGAFYEIERYKIDQGTVFRKDQYVATIDSTTRGIFGELVGDILNTFRIVGNFQRLDGVQKSGILHMAAEVPDAIPKIAAYAYYDRIGIETGSDLFKLDDNSVARIGLGYKIKPYLLLNMDYIYTFVFDEKADTWKAQERFEPRVSFVWRFGE
ncbi:hypothetical protein JW960_17380 [candidate division KSB1 bacterium]|nr:hypothetical protein [candidate division KSB1 bacterium]